MSKNSGSLLERMKSMPLWKLGGICVFSGMLMNLVALQVIDAANMRRAEARASQIGVSCAAGLFIVGGLVLVVLHFVRRKRT